MNTTRLEEYVKNFACKDNSHLLFELNLDEKNIQPSSFSAFTKEQNELINSMKTMDLCHLIWSIKAVEKKLLHDKKIQLEHPLYNTILSAIASKDKFQQHTFYFFLYFLSLELPNIADHWKNQNYLNQKHIEHVIFKEILSNGTDSLNFFKQKFSISEIEQFTYHKFESFNFESKPFDLNLREYIVTSYIHSSGNSKRKILYLYNEITKQFNLPLRLEYLNKVVPLSGFQFYQIQALNDHKLSNVEATIFINNKDVTTTLENISKYNAMIKNLVNSMNKTEAYGLDGKKYQEFPQLVAHFNSDPFLHEHINEYMKGKSDKALKKENKATWLYHSMNINIDKSSEVISKRNKI